MASWRNHETRGQYYSGVFVAQIDSSGKVFVDLSNDKEKIK